MQFILFYFSVYLYLRGENKDYIKLFSEIGKVIDYWKMDIEDHEWNALETALNVENTTHQLAKIKQIGIKMHVHQKNAIGSKEHDYARFQGILFGLRSNGFVLWDWHMDRFNMHGGSRKYSVIISNCYELIFINLNYL